MISVKRWKEKIILGISLASVSFALHYLHYLIFHDAHHIFLYLLGDIAFIPVNVLAVTLIIDNLLNEREKKSRLEKLNMVIGTFFSEVGASLIRLFSQFDPEVDEIRQKLMVSNDWTGVEFHKTAQILKDYQYQIDIPRIDLQSIRDFLSLERDFMLRLLENPNILEHESFTELLRAVFHLTEELMHRKGFTALPESDLKHIAGDLKRVYTHLIYEWLDYMKFLKNNYPYLFSLAIRMNPFDTNANPVVF